MPLDPILPQPPPQDLAAAPQEAKLPGGIETLEWALIRYVGQPMGEFISLPAEGLDLGRAPENGR